MKEARGIKHLIHKSKIIRVAIDFTHTHTHTPQPRILYSVKLYLKIKRDKQAKIDGIYH